MMLDFDIKAYVEANPDLVTRKESVRYPGLFVLKYHRRVFYKALWTPELCEMRGLVVDADYNVVVRPFTKVFNRGEMGTDIDLYEQVTWVEKVNGFMAAATMTDEYGLIISTTGSMDSDFAVLARQHIERHGVDFPHGLTYLFEICDPSDPHIIKEMPGAYLIGIRHVDSGASMTEVDIDKSAAHKGFNRPNSGVAPFFDVLQMSQAARHEGYMVYGDTVSLKLKSPNYLCKKLLARMTEKRFENNWLDTQQMREILDEEYYPLLDHIRDNRERFRAMDEQERLRYMEDYLIFNAWLGIN